MSIPRRYLPSISLLVAFEATIRNGSITAAARELSLTQGAVSRQVQALEEQLGVELFRREKKRLFPTRRARTYATEIKTALDRIGRSSVDLTANPDGGVLNLAILPTFGTRWLAPRLGRFLSSHMGITVNLSTRLRPFDFGVERFDAAIHFGYPDWPNAEHFRLMKEWVVPCCSQELFDDLAFEKPADLLEAPLLYLETRPDAWEHWFRGQDVSASNIHGMQFDQFATMARAASVGLGVALLPTFLIETEITDGSLVSAFGEPTHSDGEYYLVWPKDRSAYPPLERFRQWIEMEIRG